MTVVHQHHDVIAVHGKLAEMIISYWAAGRETRRVWLPKTCFVLAGEFDEKRNANRGDQHRELRTISQRAIRETFDENSDQRANSSGESRDQ